MQYAAYHTRYFSEQNQSSCYAECIHVHFKGLVWFECQELLLELLKSGDLKQCFWLACSGHYPDDSKSITFFHCLGHSLISLTMNGRQQLYNYFMFKPLINSIDRDFMGSIALYHTFGIFYFFFFLLEWWRRGKGKHGKTWHIDKTYSWIFIFLVY